MRKSAPCLRPPWPLLPSMEPVGYLVSNERSELVRALILGAGWEPEPALRFLSTALRRVGTGGLEVGALAAELRLDPERVDRALDWVVPRLSPRAHGFVGDPAPPGMFAEQGGTLPGKYENMRVLVVDDDAEFRKLLTIALEKNGVEWEAAESAEAGLEVLQGTEEGDFDVVLLDVQMPGATGWELLYEVRRAGNEVPVVFVTSVDTPEERIKGLKLGADDYVTKPVLFDELVARIEAVVRRRRSLAPMRYGDLSIDLARRRVQRNDNTVHLSPREYDLLLALVLADGQVVPRAKLLLEVWGLEFDPGTNVLDVHLGRMRRKVDRHGRPLVETVRGEGYRLIRHASEPTA